MAVYKRGYQRYEGPRTGSWERLLVLPRYAWQRLLGQRLVIVLLVASLFFPLGCAGYIYLANHLQLLAGFGPVGSFFQINSSFFLVFMSVQAVFAIILAAFAGPSLIAPDLANGALPLYFSRPLSRPEYVAARMLVLVGILSPVTWIPGLLLFTLQSGTAGWSWFIENWNLGAGVVAGLLLWVILVSLVALACSAYVKWRVVAGGLVLGTFFILAGATQLIKAVLRADWPMLLDPAEAMSQVWNWMLGADPINGPSAVPCAIAITVLGAGLLAILWRKLRPVEVVR